jgi:hypothetical protein
MRMVKRRRNDAEFGDEDPLYATNLSTALSRPADFGEEIE